MSESRERLLSAFIDAWNAGERPRLEDYVERAASADREELAEAIEGYVELAPTPAYDAQALEAIRAEATGNADPAPARAPLPTLLARARSAAGLDVWQLAGRLARELSLPGEREDKVAAYASQLERGELDARRLSRRVLDALGRALSVDPEALERASQVSGGPAPIGARFRGGDAEGAARQRDRLEALADLMATPAPGEWDEVDELFRGGG